MFKFTFESLIGLIYMQDIHPSMEWNNYLKEALYVHEGVLDR